MPARIHVALEAATTLLMTLVVPSAPPTAVVELAKDLVLVFAITLALATRLTTVLTVPVQRARRMLKGKCAVSAVQSTNTDDEDGRGVCKCDGTCACDFGFSGDSCECTACEGEPSVCSGHGSCSCGGTCVCDKGWTSSKANGVCDCPGRFWRNLVYSFFQILVRTTALAKVSVFVVYASAWQAIPCYPIVLAKNFAMKSAQATGFVDALESVSALKDFMVMIARKQVKPGS